MSQFDKQLKHTVTIERPASGSLDEYGQPARTFSDLATGVKALIQPKPARMGGGAAEEPVTYYAGTQITDHTVFMRVTSVTAADRILATDAGIHTGKRFEVLQVKDAGGQNHHLELDVRLLEAA